MKCNFMHSEWCRFLGIREASISALWMAPKECIDVAEAVDNGLNNYVMAFDALVDLCPVIEHFKRGLRHAPSDENADTAAVAGGGNAWHSDRYEGTGRF